MRPAGAARTLRRLRVGSLPEHTSEGRSEDRQRALKLAQLAQSSGRVSLLSLTQFCTFNSNSSSGAVDFARRAHKRIQPQASILCRHATAFTPLTRPVLDQKDHDL